MKKVISWNNKRHSAAYWISIVMLLFVAINIIGWLSLNEHSLIGSLRNNIYQLYLRIIPSFVINGGGVEFILLTLITFYLIVLLFVWLLNHFLGILPNLRVCENSLRYAYLLKTVVIEDIIIGIVLEVCALKGLREV